MKRKAITMLLLSVSLSMSSVPAFAASPGSSISSEAETAQSAQSNDTETNPEAKADGDRIVISAEELEEKVQVATDSENGNQTTLPTPDILKENSPLKQKTGSIVIKLTDGAKGTKKEGIEFTVTKVADIINGEYVLLDKYTKPEHDLNEIKTAAQLEAAANALMKQVGKVNTKKDVVKTDANGMVSLKDLSVGVYLISAKDTKTFDTIIPSLVAIPSFNETKGEMVYDLTVQPKHSPKPKPSSPGPKPVHKTGVDSPMYLYFGGAGILATLVAFINRKKKEA